MVWKILLVLFLLFWAPFLVWGAKEHGARWAGSYVLATIGFPFVAILVIPFALFQWIPWWMNTPDAPDLASQGLDEPAVAWVYKWFGQRVKTWYWLGWRNQLYGLFWRWAPKAGANLADYINTNDKTKPQATTPQRLGEATYQVQIDGVPRREYLRVVPSLIPGRLLEFGIGWKILETAGSETWPQPCAFLFRVRFPKRG